MKFRADPKDWLIFIIFAIEKWIFIPFFWKNGKK